MRIERSSLDQRSGQRQRVRGMRRHVGGGVRQQQAARRQVPRAPPHRARAQRARPRRARAAVPLRPERVWNKLPLK